MLGDNLQAEPAYAEFKVERLPELAEQLVRKRVDLISCASDLAAVAAARATQTIPNYLYNVIYPVELGLIDSYVLPGRNPDGASDNGSRSLCSAIACRARSCSARWSSREACCPMVPISRIRPTRTGAVSSLSTASRHSAGRVARRGPAAVPVGDQPQDRERPRVGDAAVVAVAGGFGLAVNAGAGPDNSRSRKARGDSPSTRLKTRLKCAGSAKPNV
jgi:hypothetical protein